jgi:nucleoside-diphosphate-sugar epimerase
LDLSNHNSIKDSLKSISYDTIIHFGANIGFNKKYEEIYSENVQATEIISNITYEKNARIIFASGTIVYDEKLEYVDGSSEPKPSSPYGVSKLKAEEVIKNSQVKNSILRIGGVFGLNGPNHLKLNTTIKDALEKKIPTFSGNINSHRNYIYIKDLVETILYFDKKNINGLHIVAGNKKISFIELIKNICDVMMPGSVPNIINENIPLKSQFYKPSDLMPQNHSFIDCLKDIKYDYENI